jgi:hypothetical protein
MGVKLNVYSVLVENLEGKRTHFNHFGVDGQTILKQGWVEKDCIDSAQ